MPVQQNSTVLHNVPVMKQPQTWACWYTSFQMVVAYQRSRGLGDGLSDPSEVPWVQSIYDKNKGIGATSDERERVAKALGFQVQYASLSQQGVWEMLLAAPLIYAGRWPKYTFGHFVVLVGIEESKIVINNPVGQQELYDYNWFASEYLIQTEERPLIFP